MSEVSYSKEVAGTSQNKIKKNQPAHLRVDEVKLVRIDRHLSTFRCSRRLRPQHPYPVWRCVGQRRRAAVVLLCTHKNHWAHGMPYTLPAAVTCAP